MYVQLYKKTHPVSWKAYLVSPKVDPVSRKAYPVSQKAFPVSKKIIGFTENFLCFLCLSKTHTYSFVHFVVAPIGKKNAVYHYKKIK